MNLLNILSALRENEAYLNSIQGRIDILTNSFQTMWMNFLDSEVIKFIINVVNGLVKIIDNIGVLQTAVTVLGGVILKNSLGDKLFPSKQTVQQKAQDLAKIYDQALEKFNANPTDKNRQAMESAKKNLDAYDEINVDAAASSVDELADAADDAADSMGAMGTTGEEAGDKVEKGAKKGSAAFKSFANSAKQMLYSMAAMYVISTVIEGLYSGIKWLVNAIDESSESAEELHDKYAEASDALSKCESEVKSLESELKTTNDKMEELMSQGTLSFVEQEELSRLKEVSAELERQLTITQTLQKSLQTGTNAAAYNAGQAFLDTSFASKESKSERQEKAAEKGGTIGKYAGLGIGALAGVIAVLAAVPSGGLSLAALPGILGAGAGTIGLTAMGASMAGEVVGSSYASSTEGKKYNQEQSVQEAIADMDASRDALIKARDEAYEAYAQADDKNRAKLQEEYDNAVSDLATYDENMANAMSTLQQYYNSIMSSWDVAKPEEQETARQIGDMLGKYSVVMGTKDAKQSAIDRMFGKEADDSVKRAKAELERMAKAGEKIDLKKAFGSNTAAYDKFVERLREQNIYVYECEDAFIELAKAEAAAAEVSFSDIAKDINGSTEAITSAKTALEDFLGAGTTSTDTVLDLKEAFGIEAGTDELKAAYEKYVQTMLSGNSSIEDAKQATADLVQTYLSDNITGSDFTKEQKQIYTSQLKELGIANAEQFITSAMQRAGIQQIEAQLKETPSATSANAKIQEIVELYELETETVDTLLTKLREKKQLESDVDTAKKNLTAYTEFFKGSGTEKGFEALKEEYENNSKQYATAIDEINKKYSDEVKNFDSNEWYWWGGFKSKYVSKNPERADVEYDQQQMLILQQQHQKYQNELANIVIPDDEYQKKIQEGIAKGFLNADGSIVQGVEEALNKTVTDVQTAVDNANTEIDATFTVDYELEFLKPEMVNTVSGITEALEQYKSVLEMVNEIAVDGQVISEEYYNTLREQIGEATVGTEDFFDAIDTSNGYIVKNADLLKKLADQSKKAQSKNVKLAKSQAMLEYYELTKDMSKYIKMENGVLITDAKQVVTLSAKANALAKVISKYALLEQKLLGATNAYDEFEKAQQADAEVDIMSNAEDMVLALGQAFNTGELGTETAQAAINGIIPDSIYKDIEALDTAEERMAEIYKYFKEGKIAQYFDLEFDEDGNITAVEAKLGNMRKFIEDGLVDNKVFQGNWENFEYSEEFLTGLETAEDKLEYFADQFGITKEMALAMIKKIEDSDVGHIIGNYGSLFDVLMPDSLEGNIYNVTQAISNAGEQLANGTIDAEEYKTQMYGLNGLLNSGSISAEQYSSQIAVLDEQLAKGQITQQRYNELVYGLTSVQGQLADQARNESVAYLEKTSRLNELNTQLDKYYKTLSANRDKDGNIIHQAVEDETIAKIKEVETEVRTLSSDLAKLEEPTELTLTLAKDQIDAELAQIESTINKTHYEFNVEAGEYKVLLNENDPEYKKVVNYVNLLNEQRTIDLALGEETKTVEETLGDVVKTLSDIAKILETGFTFMIDDEGKIQEFKNAIAEIPATKDVSLNVTETITRNVVDVAPNMHSGNAALNRQYTKYANGTAHASGTAFADGNWGAPKTETALTGELGPEILVRGNRWTTVGENGAEFTQVKKGDIIFNHEQSKQLLENGYVTSRGKAYAGGTTKTGGSAYAFSTIGYSGADVTIFPDGSSKTQWEGTGYDGPDDDTYSLESALNDAADAASEFEETLDWIEIRLEEWDETIGKLNSELENMTGYLDKNKKIDEIINASYGKKADLKAGADYYEQYAQKYLNQLSGDYRTFAQNGAIAVEDFAGEADEKTVEAINKYREYIQKSSDLRDQEEQLVYEIRQLSIQQIDNAQHTGDVKVAVEDSQTEKLQTAVDFDEARGIITDPNYYAAMMENSERSIAYLTEARNAMQKEFDDAVAKGDIKVGDDNWYENLDKLYKMDIQINNARTSMENFQNSINDIYWEGFDEVISNFENLSEEAQGLVDILSSEDMFTEPDYENGWDERDVQWTKEGLATLGLHAQEMERAEAKAQAYGTAIDDLTKEYQAGHYSESEYNEKLAELTKGQMDAIKAAKSEKDAIVDLNKSRVEAIKNGINKQVEAYEELIQKKKESLDADKDIYDFQKSVQEQQKDISAIERKIAALRGDNSASAIAQRKKLEAELAEAKAGLQETYYERSIENQQTALDNELETFKEAKDKEIETWDKYLEDVETVVAESLGIVKENAVQIGSTLATTASEYNLTISEAILDPWKEGHGAIDTYTKKFGDSVSPTTKALETIKGKWDALKQSIALANAEADKYYNKKDATADGPSVTDINAENQRYYSNPTGAKASTNSGSGSGSNGSSGGSSGGSSNQSQPIPAVGSTVTVDSSATKFGSKSGSAAMASFVRGGSYTVYQVADGQVLIGRDGVYTGWVNLSDLQGYAKGTKSTPNSGLVTVDELGEELILGAHNGRLTYLEKGSGVIPADITSNLMAWGELNPQDMLDRNRPSVGLHPEIHNTQIQIDNSIGELIHIDKCDQSTLPDVEKIVNKALDKHMQTLNNSLKRFTR